MMTRIKMFGLAACLFSVPAVAAEPAAPAKKEAAAAAAAPAKEAPAPELKKTVDIFAGKHAFNSTITMAGKDPLKFKSTVDCKKTALGKAVTCSMTGTVPGMGPFEAGLLIGYDTHGKAVHFMAMTSDEEIHDH